MFAVIDNTGTSDLLPAYILTLVLALPFVSAAIVAFSRPAASVGGGHRAGRIALACSLVVLMLAAIAMVLYLDADGGNTVMQGGKALEAKWSWVTDAADDSPQVYVDIHYAVSLDGLNVWLVMLTALMTVFAICAGLMTVQRRATEFYVYVLLVEAGLIGAFCANDLLLFFVFFELTMLPLFMLIAIFGGDDSRAAAFRCFGFNAVGSALTFAAILFMAYQAYVRYGVFTFDREVMMELSLTRQQQALLFLAMTAGLSVRIPLFPLHAWLPSVHGAAPVTANVLVAGCVLKLGVYGLLRFVLPMTTWAAQFFAPAIAMLAMFGLGYAALKIWAQSDLKRLIAYLSIAHLSVVVIGVFSLKPDGVAGAVVQLVNHGLCVGALFIVVGMIEQRFGTARHDQVRGLIRHMPRMSALLLFFALATIGLPGLNGYVGMCMIVKGLLATRLTVASPAGPLCPWVNVVVIPLLLVVAVCVLRRVVGMLSGKSEASSTGAFAVDATSQEIAVLLPIAGLCLLLGFLPSLLTHSVEPAVMRQVVKEVFELPENYEDPTQTSYEAIAQSPFESAPKMATGGDI